MNRLCVASFAGLVLAMAQGAYSQEPVVEYADAKPVDTPLPSYPALAAWFGIVGRCEVRFSVDTEGYVVSPSTFCTQPIFCYESKRAVTAVRFEPKIINGQAAPRLNVVYPLVYAFENTPDDFDFGVMKPCRRVAIS